MARATAPNSLFGGVQCAENIGIVAEHDGSRHTAPPISQSSPEIFVDVGGDANPYRAASAVPLSSRLMAWNPSTLLMFDGLPQFQASCTANATMVRSSRMRASSACGNPMPHAFSGFDVSLQFSVLLLQLVVAKPLMPIPDRMFHVATLNVVSSGGFCGVPSLVAGCVGEPPHARLPAHTVTAAAKPLLQKRAMPRLMREKCVTRTKIQQGQRPPSLPPRIVGSGPFLSRDRTYAVAPRPARPRVRKDGAR